MHYTGAWESPHVIPAFIALSVVTGLLYRKIAEKRHWLAWGTLAAGIALAGALALTLTPPEWDTKEKVTCILAFPSTLGLLQLPDLNQDSLNALLLLPFGFFAVLATRRVRTAIIPVLLIPVFIEITQSLVPALDRTCNTQDIVNNITGGLVGIGLGLLVQVVGRRFTPQ